MMIKLLSAPLQSKLRSDITISGVSQCVEELVLNALDAQSTCIAVRIDLDTQKVQVVDNGCGVAKEEMELLTQRYATSKCHQLEDLECLPYYGFRGEALASIRDMCYILEIETRLKSSSQTYVLVCQRGKVVQQSSSRMHRPSPGTTVTVYELFHSMHVRGKSLNKSVEMQKTKQRLEAIALVNYAVSFSLKDEVSGKLIVQTHTSSCIIGAFSHLFGTDMAQQLCKVSYTKEPFSVHGFLSKEPVHYNHHQLVYVNKRLVLKTKIHKLINRLLKKSVIAEKKPLRVITDKCASSIFDSFSSPDFTNLSVIYFVNITCPLSEYDITFDSNKTLVAFKHWSIVFDCVYHAILKFIQENGFTQAEGLNRNHQSSETSFFAENSSEVASTENPPGILVDDHGHQNGDRYGGLISTTKLANTLHSNTARRQLKPNTLGNIYSEFEQSCDGHPDGSSVNISSSDILGSSLSIAANRIDLTRKHNPDTLSEVDSVAPHDIPGNNAHEINKIHRQLTITADVCKSTEQDSLCVDVTTGVSKCSSSLAIIRANQNHMLIVEQEEQNHQQINKQNASVTTSALLNTTNCKPQSISICSPSNNSGISNFWKMVTADVKEKKELHHMQQIKEKLISEQCSSDDMMSSLHTFKYCTPGNVDIMYKPGFNKVQHQLSANQLNHVKQVSYITDIAVRRQKQSLLSGLFQLKRRLKTLEKRRSHRNHWKRSIDTNCITNRHSLLSGLCKVKEKLKTDSFCNENKQLDLQQTVELASCDHTNDKACLSRIKRQQINKPSHTNSKCFRLSKDQGKDQPSVSSTTSSRLSKDQGKDQPSVSSRCNQMHVQKNEGFAFTTNANEQLRAVDDSSNTPFRQMKEFCPTNRTQQGDSGYCKDVYDDLVECTGVNHSKLLETNHSYVSRNHPCTGISLTKCEDLLHQCANDLFPTSLINFALSSEQVSIANSVIKPKALLTDVDHVNPNTMQKIHSDHGEIKITNPTLMDNFLNGIPAYTDISMHRIVNVAADINIVEKDSCSVSSYKYQIPEVYSRCNKRRTIDEICDINSVNLDKDQYMTGTDGINLMPELANEDSQGFCTEHLQGLVINDEFQAKQANKSGLQDFQRDDESQRYQIYESSEGFQINDDLQGFQLNQEAQEFQLNNVSQGLQINKESQGFHITDDSQGFQINKESQGFQTSDESQGFQINDESQGFQINKESRGFQTGDESQGFQTKDESQGFHINKESQGFQIHKESQGFQTNDESQGFHINDKSQGFQMNREFHRFQMNSEFQLNMDTQEYSRILKVNKDESEGFQINNESQGFHTNNEPHKFQINRSLEGFQLDDKSLEHNMENKKGVFQIASNKEEEEECHKNNDMLTRKKAKEMTDDFRAMHSQVVMSKVPYKHHTIDTANSKTDVELCKKNSSGRGSLQKESTGHSTSKLSDNWAKIASTVTGEGDVYVNLVTGNTYANLPDVLPLSNSAITPEISNYTIGCAALLPRPQCERFNKLDCAPMSSHSLNCVTAMLKCYIEGINKQEHVKWKDGLNETVQSLEMLKDWTNPMFQLPEQGPVKIIAGESTRTANLVHQAIHSLTFTKDMMHNFKVLKQVDNKFIACLINSDNKTATKSKEHHLLVLVDQHAAHERVRLEKFTRDVYDETSTDTCRKIRTVVLDSPVSVSLSKDHVLMMATHRECFKIIGVEFCIVSDQTIHISTIPCCLLNEKKIDANKRIDKVLLETLLKEHIELLHHTPGGRHCLPNTIHQMLCSRACHGAIKFGETLSSEECVSLLQSLSQCQLPFQCAHGRPTLVPILDLNELGRSMQTQQISKAKRPKLWKLQSNNQC